MRKFFTLQRAVIRFALSSLVIFGSLNAKSQCSTSAATTCPTVTETFTANSFIAGAGFQYDEIADNYVSTNSTITPLQITSPNYQIVGNILTVGGQITEEAGKIASATIQIIENGVVICSYTRTGGLDASGKICAQISGLNGKVVQFRFIFNRRTQGNSGVGIVRFDNFGIDPSQTILPVNFISFDAKSENNGTNLTWKVADQIDVLRYDVERSSNGNNFSKIGEVAAADVTTYTFTDNQPAQGTVYYRVKNVDVDGKFKYSTIVSIRNGNAAIVLKAFPTPAKNNVTLQHGTANAKTIIRISAHDGRQVAALRPAAGSMQTGIDLSAYALGLYLISFDNGNGQVETLKVVKQ